MWGRVDLRRGDSAAASLTRHYATLSVGEPTLHSVAPGSILRRDGEGGKGGYCGGTQYTTPLCSTADRTEHRRVSDHIRCRLRVRKRPFLQRAQRVSFVPKTDERETRAIV